MERTLGVERVYKIDNYETLRLSDTSFNIPENLIFDTEFAGQVRFLQFLALERAVAKYIAISKSIEKMKPEEVIPTLDKLISETTDKILNKLTPKEE